MTTQLFVLLLIGTVLAVYLGIALTAWVRLRGTRVVICPETQEPVSVTLDRTAVKAYAERLRAWNARIEALAKRLEVPHLLVPTDVPVETLVHELLARRLSGRCEPRWVN